MSKVFSCFHKNIFVNSKVVIPIIAGIVIVIIGAVAISDQEPDTIELKTSLIASPVVGVAISDQEPDTIEIESSFDEKLNEEMISEVEDKIDMVLATNAENEYTPKPREWITSGPFQIDRSEYILGEKIFMRTGGLGYDEKGEVAFLRPLNSTHYSVYLTLPFDGTDAPAFNYYLEPKLSKINGYCTIDDFVGDWRVVFRGTDYPNLEFKITEQIFPGEEEDYEPVC